MRRTVRIGSCSLGLLSEFNRFRRATERAECRGGVFEIQDLGIVVIRAVHCLQDRHLVQHGRLDFPAVVIDQLAGEPEPFAVLERADFHFRVRSDLLGNRLHLAGLDIELAFIQERRSERPHPRLVSFDRRQIIRLRFVQKLINLFNAFHVISSLDSLSVYIYYIEKKLGNQRVSAIKETVAVSFDSAAVPMQWVCLYLVIFRHDIQADRVTGGQRIADAGAGRNVDVNLLLAG